MAFCADREANRNAVLCWEKQSPRHVGKSGFQPTLFFFLLMFIQFLRDRE